MSNQVKVQYKSGKKYKCPYCDTRYVISDLTTNCPSCGTVYGSEYDKMYAEWEKQYTNVIEEERKKNVVRYASFLLGYLSFLIYMVVMFKLLVPFPKIKWALLLSLLFFIFSIVMAKTNIGRYKKVKAGNINVDDKDSVLAELMIAYNVKRVVEDFSEQCNCPYCGTMLKYTSASRTCTNCGSPLEKYDNYYNKAVFEAKMQDKKLIRKYFESCFLGEMLLIGITVISFIVYLGNDGYIPPSSFVKTVAASSAIAIILAALVYSLLKYKSTNEV